MATAYPDFWDSDWLCGHMSKAIEASSSRLNDQVRAMVTDLRFDEPPLESPVEACFYAWFKALAFADFDGLITLSAQREVVACGNRYRLDFAIETPNHMFVELARLCRVAFPKIAVEIDGHDFHERTKEQVAYRNQRDRDLQAGGWTVLHFSGTEVNRDPVRCVMEAARVGYEKFNEFEREVRIAVIDRLRGDAHA